MSLKKLFWLIIILGLLGGGGFIAYHFYQDAHAWKVVIALDEVNVRENHNLYERKMATVYEDQTFNVLEQYLDDPRYVWYKIEYEHGKTGWIASGRNNPYVKEINSPNATGNEEGNTYELDYKKPVIKFDDNLYVVYDINSISYKHLTIEEDSDYTIEHKVYYEEFPKDSDIPQYWIQYIVTDAAGNVAKKVQQIKFDIEPDRSEVLDFADLER